MIHLPTNRGLLVDPLVGTSVLLWCQQDKEIAIYVTLPKGIESLDCRSCPMQPDYNVFSVKFLFILKN